MEFMISIEDIRSFKVVIVELILCDIVADNEDEEQGPS